MAEAALTLAFVPGVTPAKWLRVWAERHPAEPVAPMVVTVAEQVSVLHDALADLALVRLPIDVTGLHVIPLYEELAVVVVPADHALTDLGAVELADLADETLLGLPDLDERQLVEVVATGAGLAIMPQSLARLHARKDVRAVPVTDAPTTRVALAWRRDHDSPLIEDFIGVVRGRTARSSRGEGAASAETDATGRQKRSSGSAASGNGAAKGAGGKRASGGPRSGARSASARRGRPGGGRGRGRR